jgi:prepilin-type processing-associated H-X9-DG protein
MLAAPATAQLSINRLWVDLEPGQSPRSDLVIRNDSADRYYISVQTYEVTDPGTPQEDRRQIADPEALGLLVTPNRLILEPGATRSIRVVSLNTNLTQDRIYRVLIRPEVGTIRTDAAPTDERDVAIKLLAAYDVLVVARPPRANARITSRREADRIVISNSGNTNALLFDGHVCPQGISDPDDTRCHSLPATRVYAGGSFEVPLQNAGDVVIFRERETVGSDPHTVQF